jgi:1-acyl-sn-glycerol-3-phosphate acyltransferase
MNESLRRRLVTVPSTIAALLILTLFFPLLFMLTIVVDFGRWLLSRKPWMATRLLLMGWVYLALQAAVIVVAAVQWVASIPFGGGAATRRAAWAYKLQAWWVRMLMAAMGAILSLRFEISGDAAVPPGPIIVLFRHASIVDNVLPHAFVTDRHGIKLRWVLKKELLTDPALDIGGNRMPNYFVDRSSDSPEVERANIAELGTNLATDEGILLFPEGTRFSATKRATLMDRLAESSPELHEIMEGHDQVLPPRPGGVLALLDSGMDVVIGVHTGLENMRGLKEIWNTAPIGRTVKLDFRRIPASQIPDGSQERVRWLHEEWARVGDTIALLQNN